MRRPPHDGQNPPFFAGIRDKPVQSAGIVVNPQKTPGQHATIQECTQLQLHEARHYPVSLPLPGKEGLQIFCNDTIKNCLFGIAGHIRANVFTNDEIRFSSHECAITG
jgi:hypothetical protein